MSRPRFRALSVLAVSGLAASGSVFAACSDSGAPDTGAAPGADAGSDGPATVPSSGAEAKQTGKILQAQTSDGVAGATVAVAGKTATTNANGDYEILVPRGTPYQMSASAEGYWKVLEQEWILNRDALARGPTNIILTQTAYLLASFLDGRNKEKGTLVVRVEVMPPCATDEGATLTLDPPGESKLVYFNGQIPDVQATSVHHGSTFAAAFYNVDVGVPVRVGVSSPVCKPVPFPVETDDVTYTGVNRVEADEAVSFHRVYLRDPIADGGR